MTERNVGINFYSMDWRAPLSGWPEGIADVPFVLSAGPEANSPLSWLDGSNCQRFAYGVLDLYGMKCPPLRSSNLWEDDTATSVVFAPEFLDLVLFNSSDKSFGAHIGVIMAPNEILHLSQEIGIPALWSFEDFALRPRYSTVVGIKRVSAR
jgi:hypothetical protein